MKPYLVMDGMPLKTPDEIGAWVTQAGMTLMEAAVAKLVSMAPVTHATRYQRVTVGTCAHCSGCGFRHRLTDDCVYVMLCSCLELRRIDPL